MRSLLEPEITELDPETRAVVDEVCQAMEEASADPWGAVLPAFGEKWLIAMRATGDHELRRRIFAAMDANVRSDPELFVGVSGYIYTRQQIARYDGRITYIPDAETGRMRKCLEFPSDRTAGGKAWYGKREPEVAG